METITTNNNWKKKFIIIWTGQLCSILSSSIAQFSMVLWIGMETGDVYKRQIFDTIGLALFTVVGVGKSIALGYPFWVAIIMGSITGAAGGVIRDVFINEIPLIFRKEIYAMACVVGGIAYWLCDAAGMESYVCQLVEMCIRDRYKTEFPVYWR